MAGLRFGRASVDEQRHRDRDQPEVLERQHRRG
jgi:hypothetical protein